MNRSYVRDILRHIKLAANVPAVWRVFVAKLAKGHATAFVLTNGRIFVLDSVWAPTPIRSELSKLGVRSSTSRKLHFICPQWQVEGEGEGTRFGGTCLFLAIWLSARFIARTPDPAAELKSEYQGADAEAYLGHPDKTTLERLIEEHRRKAADTIMRNYQDEDFPICYSFLAEDGGLARAAVPSGTRHDPIFPIHFPKRKIYVETMIWLCTRGPSKKPPKKLSYDQIIEELGRRLGVVGDSMGLALARQATPRDGNCQFHAVIRALRNQPQVTQTLRKKAETLTQSDLRA